MAWGVEGKRLSNGTRRGTMRPGAPQVPGLIFWMDGSAETSRRLIRCTPHTTLPTLEDTQVQNEGEADPGPLRGT